MWHLGLRKPTTHTHNLYVCVQTIICLNFYSDNAVFAVQIVVTTCNLLLSLNQDISFTIVRCKITDQIVLKEICLFQFYTYDPHK